MDAILEGSLFDLDTYLQNDIVAEEIIWVNDLDYYDDSDIKLLRSELFTTLTSNVIPIIPSCKCGNLKVGYLRGVTCDICHTTVDNRYGDIKPFIWIRRLEGMDKFLSPYFVALLDNVTGDKARRIVRWFGDSRYNPVFATKGDNREEALYKAFKSLPNFERSYNFLVANMEMILLTILKIKNYQKAKSKQLQYIIELWRNHKDTILSDALPILHKSLIVVEKTSKGSYIQASRGDVTNAAETFMRAAKSDKQSIRDRATALTVQLLTDLHVRVVADFLTGKEKLFRKNIMGSRLHFSFRQVVTPIMGKHNYTDVHMPWQSYITTMRPHIMNKLQSRGYSHKQIDKILYRALLRTDPILQEIANELIKESKGGIPVMIHRNPSQNSASILILRIVKIKTEPEDRTISMDSTVWTFANGDIDGDEANALLLLDHRMRVLLEPLTPDKDVLDASFKPGEIFSKMGISETSSATLTYRIASERQKMGIVD